MPNKKDADSAAGKHASGASHGTHSVESGHKQLSRKTVITAVLAAAVAVAGIVIGVSMNNAAQARKAAEEQAAAAEAAAQAQAEADAQAQAQAQADAEAAAKQAYLGQPFYVLVMGTDSRVGTSKYKGDDSSRADIITLVRVDPVNYKITLVSVPRDTRSTIDGQTYKINENFNVGGADRMVSAVEDVTGVKISYYFQTDFGMFEKLVDGVGGVTVDVPMTISLPDIVAGGDALTVDAGTQTLDGAHALVFARVRDPYGTNMEAIRQTNDRNIEQALITKAINASDGDLSVYLAALETFSHTNMTDDQLQDLAALFKKNSSSVTFLSGSGPYEGDTDADTNLWLVYPDTDGVWKQVISVVDSGGDPTTVVALPTL